MEKPCLECGKNLLGKHYYGRKSDNERVCETCFVDKGYYKDVATMSNFYKSIPSTDFPRVMYGSSGIEFAKKGYINFQVVKWIIENHINEYNNKLDNLTHKKDLMKTDTFELRWNNTIGGKAALKALLEELKELQL
jgi:hypothetical protein